MVIRNKYENADDLIKKKIPRSQRKHYNNLHYKFKHSWHSSLVNGNIDILDLLTDKGIYPYDYMDSFERFEETSLPSKEKFYS